MLIPRFVEQFQSTRFYIHEMKDDFKRKASGDVTAVGPDLTISIDPSNPYSAETDVRYFKVSPMTRETLNLISGTLFQTQIQLP